MITWWFGINHWRSPRNHYWDGLHALRRARTGGRARAPVLGDNLLVQPRRLRRALVQPADQRRRAPRLRLKLYRGWPKLRDYLGPTL